MSRISKHKQNKNPAEKRAYKQFLKHIIPDEDSTFLSQNPNLITSDSDYSGEIYSSQDEAFIEKPKLVKAKELLKNHIFECVISFFFSILLTAGIWLVRSTIIHDVTLATITTKIDYIEKEIGSINTKDGNVANYYEELYEIKSSITDQRADLKDISERVEVLEKRIEDID